MTNHAIIGAGGYIAPRHMRAIKDNGGKLVAATDPKDSVGILDQFGYDVAYFPEIERFDRHINQLHKTPNKIDYVSICTPNYLHDAHCRLALRAGADVICEKPLVIKARNLDTLAELELETGHKINVVLQLRLHPALIALRDRLSENISPYKHSVALKYITPRGKWYHYSWKGDIEKSGGLATNIGIHLFDMLIWLFGSVSTFTNYKMTIEQLSGWLELQRAHVRYDLSISPLDAPGIRQMTVDGEPVNFTDGFTDLHTVVYREILEGRGFGIDDARPSLELVNRIVQSGGYNGLAMG